jgi:uncharacterized protein (DUF1800 family)
LQDATIAANRFGLGARPGEIRSIAGDPRGWLIAQLEPEKALPAPLAALPSTADDTSAFIRWIVTLGLTGEDGKLASLYGKGVAKPASSMASGAMNSGAMKSGAMSSGGAAGAPQAGMTDAAKGLSVEQSYVKTFFPRYAAALEARYTVAVNTDRPFFERLTHFWGNHFTVSGAKPESLPTVPSFDRDVARRHAVGRFGDMLMASCTHPAMLVYLDNVFSVGPNSYIGQHPNVLPAPLRERMKGINENLAREILELHTLGVRSGYTQADVTSFAKIITGWMIVRAGQTAGGSGETGLFHYQPYAHEPGPQTVLGKVYADEGFKQGETALRDFSRHSATATHISTKLARHFIADDPPPAVVDRMAKTFSDTDGDLKAVMITLINSPEAWSPTPAKMKPPEDYVVSAARALGGAPLTGYQLLAVLDRMGQKPYYATGPDGWSDVEGAWIGPDPIWKRIEWATAISKARATATADPAAIAADALGPGVSAATLQSIRLAESPEQGLAIFLSSPEFQRR